MRRMILVAATSSLVLALAPASALARHHGHHHKRHHARHHAKHHARVHRVIHRRFGDVNNPSAPTTNPGPTSSSSAIGTVDSFDGTTLTIKLSSGSTVSGTVTNDTELECTSASSSSSSSSMSGDLRRDGGGDNNGGSDGQSSQSSPSDPNQSGDDDNGSGDDAGQQQSCTTGALTPGASVSGAELKISSAGAVWEKVDLIS